MCLISNKYKFISFNFPKTGSESIRSVLDSFADLKGVDLSKVPPPLRSRVPLYSHVPPAALKKTFKLNRTLPLKHGYNDYYKFCFIRNPWARVFSLYKHAAASQLPFHKFVENLDYYRAVKGANHVKYGAYSLKDWIFDKDGKMLVDKVFKLERMDEFIDEMEKIGVHVSFVPFLNQRTKPKEYRKHYNMRTRSIVARKFRYEINAFNYKF